MVVLGTRLHILCKRHQEHTKVGKCSVAWKSDMALCQSSISSGAALALHSTPLRQSACRTLPLHSSLIPGTEILHLKRSPLPVTERRCYRGTIRAVSEHSSLETLHHSLNQRRPGTVSDDPTAQALAVVASGRRGSRLSERHRSARVSKRGSFVLSRRYEAQVKHLGARSKGMGSARWKTRQGRVQAGRVLDVKSSKPVALQGLDLPYLALDSEGHRWTAPLNLKEPPTLVQYMKQVVAQEQVAQGETTLPAKMEGLMGTVNGLSIEQLLTDETVFTRELSWLCLNWRVLHVAMDQRTPLHERLRFLGIAAASLDEFFECRVASLKWKEAVSQDANAKQGTRGCRSLQERLKNISLAVRDILSAQSTALRSSILPKLQQHGVSIASHSQLSAPQQDSLRSYFKQELEPLLTPLAVDPGHPFPFIKHLSLNIAVLLRDPIDDAHQFAIVTVPSTIPRWKELPGTAGVVVALEEVVVSNLDRLFGGMEILSAHPFRATRTMLVLDDLKKEEDYCAADEQADLSAIIAQEMHERKFSPFVRLEVDRSMPREMVARLAGEMDLDLEQDVYTTGTPLALCDLRSLPAPASSPPALHFPPWQPVTHPRLANLGRTPGAIFDEIRSGGDLLVRHPYHSFGTSTQAFFEAAARDPAVVAIKAILYKTTSANSPVVQALVAAAEAGKQVAVLVELKARCEEARNINIADMLEDAGCNVAYGLVGLTTHAKASMVVRQEGLETNTYVHVGTGDYNARQAAAYSDFSLFSCDPGLGRDMSDFFKYLTGYHRQKRYQTLLIAPHSMHQQLIRLCDAEIENARKGLPAGITIKCNALDDKVLCARLYAASAAGVKVNLIVQGICRVRPGVPGISDNIRVVSIVGRFLEHSRVMRFENGGEPRFYLPSGNCTTRDLTRRVELALLVKDDMCKQELQDILDLCLSDRRTAWEMRPDGLYSLPAPSNEPTGNPGTGTREARLAAIGLQSALMEDVLKAREKAQKVERLKIKATAGGRKYRG